MYLGFSVIVSDDVMGEGLVVLVLVFKIVSHNNHQDYDEVMS